VASCRSAGRTHRTSNSVASSTRCQHSKPVSRRSSHTPPVHKHSQQHRHHCTPRRTVRGAVWDSASGPRPRPVPVRRQQVPERSWSAQRRPQHRGNASDTKHLRNQPLLDSCQPSSRGRPRQNTQLSFLQLHDAGQPDAAGLGTRAWARPEVLCLRDASISRVNGTATIVKRLMRELKWDVGSRLVKRPRKKKRAAEAARISPAGLNPHHFGGA